MSLFKELKRRNVLRIAAAYVVAAWLLIQVAETIFPLFGFDDTPARVVVIMLAIGFVPAMVLAWVFELTPEGLRKEGDVDHGRPAALQSEKKLDRIIMVVLVLALGYFAVDKFVLDPQREAVLQAQKVEELEVARAEGRSDALTESFGDNTIAVLPFVNLSSDPEQEYFADGMTEELLNILAKIPSLRVTARTSSFFFKGRDLPVASIAAALNVKHILAGTVRRSGSRVRITAQLIDAGSDKNMWSETFDRDLEDVFEIQDEVSAAIASSLVESFDATSRRPVSRARNLAAYEAYRTGRLLWWRRSSEDFLRAVDLFEKAIEADPGYAPAYAAAADTWLLLVRYGGVHYLEGIESADLMIEKALAIDAESAEAHAALGLRKLTTGDYDEAERALRKSIELDAEYIPARLWLSVVMGEHGRISEQGLVLQEAIARDPLNELLAVNYAGNLHVRGEYEQATHVLNGLLRLQPDSPSLNQAMWSLAGDAGELADAWRFAKRANEIDPSGAAISMSLARAWVSLGDLDEAERVLLEGMQRAKDNVDVKQEYVNVLVLQGRADEAEDRINRLFGPDISHLPAEIQRWHHYDRGMVAAIRSDWESARDHFELAIDPDESHLYENNQIFILTVLTQLHRGLGDPEAAEQRLATAERVVGHARINGVDDGDIYYSVSCLLTLRDQKERALQALQLAYNKGWRKYWLLEAPGCHDALRTEPAFQAIKDEITANVEQARAEVQAIAAAN